MLHQLSIFPNFCFCLAGWNFQKVLETRSFFGHVGCMLKALHQSWLQKSLLIFVEETNRQSVLKGLIFRKILRERENLHTRNLLEIPNMMVWKVYALTNMAILGTASMLNFRAVHNKNSVEWNDHFIFKKKLKLLGLDWFSNIFPLLTNSLNSSGHNQALPRIWSVNRRHERQLLGPPTKNFGTSMQNGDYFGPGFANPDFWSKNFGSPQPSRKCGRANLDTWHFA